MCLDDADLSKWEISKQLSYPLRFHLKGLSNPMTRTKLYTIWWQYPYPNDKSHPPTTHPKPGLIFAWFTLIKKINTVSVVVIIKFDYLLIYFNLTRDACRQSVYDSNSLTWSRDPNVLTRFFFRCLNYVRPIKKHSTASKVYTKVPSYLTSYINRL